jgi:tetratricopeptide (TPR) repeat protein
VGNNPTATGGYQPLVPGRADVVLEHRDAVALAERALGRRLSEREVSRYWAGRALEFIVGSPGRWLQLMGRKVLLLINRTEMCDTYDQYSYADWSLLLRWLNPLIHFGILVPLAAGGLVLTRREGEAVRLLVAMVALYGASVVLFIVLDRYRFPLVPVLTLFAAAGLARAAAAVRRGRRPELVAACLAAVAAAVPANWPLVARNELHSRVVMRNNIAVGLMESRRYAEALPHALEAIALDPQFAEAVFNAGTILQHVGRLDEALEYQRRAVRLQPESPEMRYYLGMLLSQLRRPAEAAAEFEQALRLDPEMAMARSWLELERGKLRREDAERSGAAPGQVGGPAREPSPPR